jgi:hypothetical protein
MSQIISLPRTPAGRELLRDALRDIEAQDIREFVATAFDWDASAVEMKQLGLVPTPSRRRGVDG